jgi:hypothetical protein
MNEKLQLIRDVFNNRHYTLPQTGRGGGGIYKSLMNRGHTTPGVLLSP